MPNVCCFCIIWLLPQSHWLQEILYWKCPAQDHRLFSVKITFFGNCYFFKIRPNIDNVRKVSILHCLHLPTWNLHWLFLQDQFQVKFPQICEFSEKCHNFMIFKKMQKMFHGLRQDISCIKLLVVSDFEALFKWCKWSWHSESVWVAFKLRLNFSVFDIAMYGKLVRCFYNSFEQWTLTTVTYIIEPKKKTNIYLKNSYMPYNRN